jgi:uncharacterized protein YchJ
VSIVLLASSSAALQRGMRPATHRVLPLRAKAEGSKAAGFGRAKGNDRRPERSEPCACGSGDAYGACCARLHDGGIATDIPELMRARFTAYEYRLPDFLLSPQYTLGVADSKEVRRELETYIGSYRFLNITVGEPRPLAANAAGGARAECDMTCCFRARAAEIFRQNSAIIAERVITFRERSVFSQAADGGWRYVEAESESSYEGEEGYDREAAEAAYRLGIVKKRTNGEILTRHERAYAKEHGL